MVVKGTILGTLRLVEDENDPIFYGDGWVKTDLSMTESEIKTYNKPILDAYFKESGLPQQYRYLLDL